jgi:hypothetical protein
VLGSGAADRLVVSGDGVIGTAGAAGFAPRLPAQFTDRLLETSMSTERSYRVMP